MPNRPAHRTARSALDRIKTSFGATAKLIYFRPQSLILALISSVVFYEIIFWILNLGLLEHLWHSESMTLIDKVAIVIDSYIGIFNPPFSALAALLFLVSLLQGVTVAVLWYIAQKERAKNRSILKEVGGTGVAGVLSLLGLGCAACGTSLVTPILTFFFATSSVTVAETVGFYTAVVALLVSMVAVYLSGLKLAPHLAFDRSLQK